MDISTADLMDEHGDRLQVVLPSLRHYGACKRFAGRVSTIKACEDNSLVRAAVAEAGAGRVLVVDGNASLRRAMLGDVLAKQAMDNGWKGVVLSACIRDSVCIGGMDIGVMALGTNPFKSSKRGFGERDIPVAFSGARFMPGEWLYADEDGIVLSSQPLL